MDGLLIDSEPLWQTAEIEVFGDLGVTLTSEDTRSTRGLRIDEVVALWHRRRPWSGPRPDEVVDRILDRVVALIEQEGRPKPGALAAVTLAAGAGQVALASSSPVRVIEAVLRRLELRGCFSVVRSGEQESHGKPHPAIFLSTAERLGRSAAECLVLEDSVNGVIAAKAASMACVAVPEADCRADLRFALADAVLESLVCFDLGLVEKLAQARA